MSHPWAVREPTCRWRCDDGPCFTGCGKVFEIIDGTAAENGFVWCPYCRGRIEEESC